MYVFTDSTLKYLLKKIKSKIALKSELDNKVDKVDGKVLSDNDFTDSAKSLLETKFNSVEASYSTGMAHIKFLNEDQSNIKTLDLKTGCDMFFYPTVDAELLADLEGNVTIPYAFISKSGSDIGKVTVKIENLTNNTSSENVFNVTDNGSELILEGTSSGNANVSFTIEGSTEELKANVLGEYSTVVMLPLTVYRSTNPSLIPSDISNPKTVVSDFGNGEYEIMLYTTTSTNYLNFSNVQTLTNVSYISDIITNMANTYLNCNNLTGQPICGDNVTDMSSAYNNCINLTGSPVCGPNVTNMYYTYYECNNITGSPVCGDKVINMYRTYSDCESLTGAPVCGPNVTDMEMAYASCSNLTGPAVCGNNVTTIRCTYSYCYNLTGSPVCGNNVTDMDQTYSRCQSLTGNPVCGNNVTTMYWAYGHCYNITGPAICGNKVTNMSYTYDNCRKLASNAYFYSNRINTVHGCFRGRNTQKRLNLYVPSIGYNSTHNTLASCLKTFGSNSLVENSISWTDDTGVNGYHYNTAYNIYIYPISNVAQAYKDNELLVARYTISSGANVIPEVDSATMTTMEDTTNDDGTITREILLDKSQAGNWPKTISFNGETDLLTVEKLKAENITNGTNMFKGCSNFKGFESDISQYYDLIDIEGDNGGFLGTTPYIPCNSKEEAEELIPKLKVIAPDGSSATFSIIISDYDPGLYGSSDDWYIYATASCGGLTIVAEYEYNLWIHFEDVVGTRDAHYTVVVEDKETFIPDFSNIENATSMFEGCSSLEYLDTSDWNTENITKADYMFAGCSKLTKESFEKTYYDLKYESDTYTINFNEEIKLFDYPSSEFNFITLNYPMREYEEGYSNFNPQIVRSDIDECTYYRFGNTDPIVIKVYDDGSVYALTDGPGGDISLYLYNKHKYTFELPAAESASHIFDGCTNLL